MSSSVAELTEDAVGFDGPWIAEAETDAGVFTAVTSSLARAAAAAAGAVSERAPALF